MKIREVLLLLGQVWVSLVFFMHHTVGYEKAYGYPETGESFRWTLGLGGPFFFAATFTGHGGGVERGLRWLCVLALAAEVVLLVVTSLSSYLARLPGGAAVLLIYSEWAAGACGQSEATPRWRTPYPALPATSGGSRVCRLHRLVGMVL